MMVQGATLLALSEAQSRVLGTIAAKSFESVPLNSALGRILGEPVIAPFDQPAKDRSAMDGYAVRIEDVAIVPARLRVSDSIAAGAIPKGRLEPGTAMQIFTGANLPEGSQAVVIQENTTNRGCTANEILILKSARPGENVRHAGNDFSSGHLALLPGQQINPRGVMIAAAMNYAELSVIKKPRIAILATGNELRPPGATPSVHQTIASSLPAVCAAVTSWGGIPVDLGIASDNIDEIARSVQCALEREVDMIVTLGGASVGDHDLVRAALEKLGFSLDFWRIAMKPGKPLLFGQLEHCPILGLPGNPISAMICALLFLRSSIRAFLGQVSERGCDALGLPRQSAVLAVDLPENRERFDFLRGSLDFCSNAMPIATVFSAQDSAQTSTLLSAGCLIPRNPFASTAKAGEVYPIVPLASLF